MTNVALFLGAGASVTYGLPTTKELLCRIKGSHSSTPNRVLRALLGHGYEDVEDVLQKIEDMQKSPDSVGDGGCSEQLAQMPRDALLKELADAKRVLQKEIFEACKLDMDKGTHWSNAPPLLEATDGRRETDVKEYAPEGQTLLEIMTRLREWSDTTWVLTTNFDLVVEEWVHAHAGKYSLNDGFVEWYGKTIFRPESLLVGDDSSPERPVHLPRMAPGPLAPPGGGDSSPERPVHLLKLHGSLNWIKKDGKIQKTPIQVYSDGGDHQNILIYPTRTPKDDENKPTFKILSILCQKYLRQADTLIVIGFSFRDTVAEEIRRQFVGGKKRLVILSPTGLSDYYKNLCKEDVPKSVKELFPNVFQPNDHTLILEQKLNIGTIGKALQRIGAFLDDKTGTGP